MGQCAPRKVNIQQPPKLSHSENSFKIGDFKLLKMIGKGGFSQVWKVEERKTGKLYALKVMSKAKIIAKKSVKAALMERKILTSLMQAGASGVTGMLASFQDHDSLYILMDYLQGRSLRHHLNTGLIPTQEQIRTIIFELLKVLEQLSLHQVLHRDIKPENILFDSLGRPFLTDFGIAEFVSEEEGAESDSGTVGYMAPEVMLGQTHSFTADYYSLGVVVFELFFGHRPFSATSKEEMLKAVSHTPINYEKFPELLNISSQAKDFICGLLQRKVRLRLGHSRGISQLLQHPWFAQIHSDSDDPLQNHFIKSGLTNPQNKEQPLLYESTGKSMSSHMNQQMIGGLLHRQHVQEMFRSFNSQTSSEVIARRRRLSEGYLSAQSIPCALKKSLTAQK